MILPSLVLLSAVGAQTAAQPAPGRVCIRDAKHHAIAELLILTRNSKDNDGPALTTGKDSCVADPLNLDPARGPWKFYISLQTYEDVKVPIPSPGVTKHITLKHDGDTSLQQH